MKKWQQLNLAAYKQPVYIADTASIGENIFIGAFTYIGENVIVGNNVKIFPQVFLGDNVVIGQEHYFISRCKNSS